MNAELGHLSTKIEELLKNDLLVIFGILSLQRRDCQIINEKDL